MNDVSFFGWDITRTRMKVVNDRIQWLPSNSRRIQSQKWVGCYGMHLIHTYVQWFGIMISAIAKPFISHSFVCIQNMAIGKDYITFIYHVWSVHSSNHVTRLFKWIFSNEKTWEIFLIMTAWNYFWFNLTFVMLSNSKYIFVKSLIKIVSIV